MRFGLHRIQHEGQAVRIVAWRGTADRCDGVVGPADVDDGAGLDFASCEERGQRRGELARGIVKRVSAVIGEGSAVLAI